MLSSSVRHIRSPKPPNQHQVLSTPAGFLPASQPLHIAALRGHCEAITLLLDGGLSPSAKSRRGWTPLHEAIAAGCRPAAKLLYQKMEDNDMAKNRAQREQLLATMKEMPDYSLQASKLMCLGEYRGRVVSYRSECDLRMRLMTESEDCVVCGGRR